LKSKLVESNTARLEAIERDDQIVVGVNRFKEGEPSLLTTGGPSIIIVPDYVEADQIYNFVAWCKARDSKLAQRALIELKIAACEGHNIMQNSIAAAKQRSRPENGETFCTKLSVNIELQQASW
jgi:(2R)-ethylmalonyl-CoA mutase